jgi:hypothetical protein
MMFSERVRKLFNELKPYLYKSALHEESNLIDIYMSTYGPHHIELNFIIANRYNNERILHEAIIDSTDKFLEWIDLSTLNDDFTITIQYAMGRSTESYTYFELMDSCYGDDRYGNTILINKVTHPRWTEFCQWQENKKTQNYQSNLQLAMAQAEREKSFFTRIKEKLLSL